jgi:hypothetical protein
MAEAAPELERIQAERSAVVMSRSSPQSLCADARPHNHRTIVKRLAKVADQIERWDAASPNRMSRADGRPSPFFIYGAYIRAVPGCQSRPF